MTDQQDSHNDDATSDEDVQEFVEEVENDPSQNPDDEELERVRGG
jgi:hypothetical protein